MILFSLFRAALSGRLPDHRVQHELCGAWLSLGGKQSL